MQSIIFKFFKLIRNIFHKILVPIDWALAYLVLYSNNVNFATFKTNGIPFLDVEQGGTFYLGADFKMNNRESANAIGRCRRCSFVVKKAALLKIGKHVGMSSSSIVCTNNIQIGDYVKIGGNVVIYDTDFHSLSSEKRTNFETDKINAVSAPVSIGNHVFIGAHSTILKGVTIGDRSIIGACSVVTKNIPEDQIWAGNPARFVRNLNLSDL